MESRLSFKDLIFWEQRMKLWKKLESDWGISNSSIISLISPWFSNKLSLILLYSSFISFRLSFTVSTKSVSCLSCWSFSRFTSRISSSTFLFSKISCFRPYSSVLIFYSKPRSLTLFSASKLTLYSWMRFKYLDRCLDGDIPTLSSS